MTWYLLARIVADHDGWEGEKAQIDAWVRQAVERAGESFEEVVFAPWSRTSDGFLFYYYETSSRRVFDEYLEMWSGEE